MNERRRKGRARRAAAEPRQVVAWGWLAVGVLTMLVGILRMHRPAQPPSDAVPLETYTSNPTAAPTPAPPPAAAPTGPSTAPTPVRLDALDRAHEHTQTGGAPK